MDGRKRKDISQREDEKKDEKNNERKDEKKDERKDIRGINNLMNQAASKQATGKKYCDGIEEWMRTEKGWRNYSPMTPRALVLVTNVRSNRGWSRVPRVSTTRPHRPATRRTFT